MRLIDGDALEKAISLSHTMTDDYGIKTGYEIAMRLVEDAPTIEPERKTGKWLMDGERCGELMWRCSECNVSEAVPTATSFISGVAYPQWKFCPNCGSPMDGGEQE